MCGEFQVDWSGRVVRVDLVFRWSFSKVFFYSFQITVIFLFFLGALTPVEGSGSCLCTQELLFSGKILRLVEKSNG